MIILIVEVMVEGVLRRRFVMYPQLESSDARAQIQKAFVAVIGQAVNNRCICEAIWFVIIFHAVIVAHDGSGGTAGNSLIEDDGVPLVDFDRFISPECSDDAAVEPTDSEGRVSMRRLCGLLVNMSPA
ncbi:REP helicase, putative [Babesia ovata]|uniref:REP helicase, putative n=1 Tax=Babesia ovata TaxID=189622 RepID=A0A2H6KDR1_9APIC|nr:REP helicase, putative [Babesia ovata]GBE61133.1 REP helicase, putative [Babesia ovata]